MERRNNNVYDELSKKYNMNKFFWLYDTFSGMTKPILDVDGIEPINSWKEGWCCSSLTEVTDNITNIEYDNNRIKYIVGDVCQTLNNLENIPENIAILRLDTDWYESTKKELDILFNKVINNGIIIIDDYYSWKGSKKAVDDFLQNNKNINIIDNKYTGTRFCFQKISNNNLSNNLNKYLEVVDYNQVYFTEKNQIVSNSTNNNYGNIILAKYNVGSIIII